MSHFFCVISHVRQQHIGALSGVLNLGLLKQQAVAVYSLESIAIHMKRIDVALSDDDEHPSGTIQRQVIGVAGYDKCDCERL